MNRINYLILSALSFAVFMAVFGVYKTTKAVEGYGPNLKVDYVSGVSDWGDQTSANIGDTVEFDLKIYNTNVPSYADNLTVRVDLPALPSSGTVTSTAYATTTSTTTVSGSSTTPSDSTSIVNLPSNAIVQYDPTTFHYTADLNGDGVNEKDGTVDVDTLTGTGINFGKLEGGRDANISISFSAKVLARTDPNLTVSFLSGNPERSADGWTDGTQANPGDPIQFYIEVHNTNVPSVAENLNVKVNLPTNDGTEFSPQVTVSSSNASSVSDATKITFSNKAKMTYRAQSLRITWDKNGDGVKEYNGFVWPNDDIVGNGINLGTLWGCNNFVIQLSFFANSESVEKAEAQINITKRVIWNGNEYTELKPETHLFDVGSEVQYRIIVKNTGEKDATNVKVVDTLDTYMRHIDNNERTKEFNIGTLSAGAEWNQIVNAKVVNDIPQNDRTQTNVAKVTTDNAGSAEASTIIWINGPEILQAAAEKKELPVTGPELPITLGLGSLLSAGMYLRKRLG